MVRVGVVGRRFLKGILQNPNERTNMFLASAVGLIFGFWIGVSFMGLTTKESKVFVEDSYFALKMEERLNRTRRQTTMNHHNSTDTSQIYDPPNPRGAEALPPGIVESESDLYLRRLWGDPSEDLPFKQKYLVTFTVGVDQKKNIDAVVKKFSGNFTILLFHYDGRTTEWDEFEWSKQAIHVSVLKQTKWWYAKRFLHPDIVACYDYIFIWDEDLGVENFDAEEYIKIVKKHGLEISQPGLGPGSDITWQMTKMKPDSEVHILGHENGKYSLVTCRTTVERPGWCTSPHLPPCAAFVEIMATVFSRDAWRCVWYMIQNDLVHGWGLDFALKSCVKPAHEKIGVVDSQWIVHQGIPSLHRQGPDTEKMPDKSSVKTRCRKEWVMFKQRMSISEKVHFFEEWINKETNSTLT